MPRLDKIRPASSKSVAQSLGDVAGAVQYSGQTEGDAGEIAFGGPTADFILYGVVNGAFAQGPADPDNDIDPQNNPLHYWVGPTQVSGGAITCQWVVDASSPSGYNLRFTINPGAAGDEAYFEQILPIGGFRSGISARHVSMFGIAGAANTGSFTIVLSRSYLDVDGNVLTTTTGTNSLAAAATNRAQVGDSAAPAGNAYYIRLRIGVRRTGAATESGTIDLSEIRLPHQPSRLLLPDQNTPATYDPGTIYQADGAIEFQPEGTMTAFVDGDGLTAAEGLIQSKFTASAQIVHSGVIAATISGNQNNYAPTGIATCSFIGFTVSGAARTITGWDATGFTEGQTFSISTSGGNDLVFDHASASSSSGNRIASANSVSLTVRSGGGCTFMYVPSYSAANPFRIIAANA